MPHKRYLVGLCLLLLAVFVIPAFGQEIGPGEGAPVIYPNFGADIATTNPILAQDGTSQRIYNMIYPNLLQVDSNTGNIAPGVPDSLVTSWDVSDDGKTYTFHLRDDWYWSDNTQVTSADVQYVWDAIQNPDLQFNGNLQDLKDKVENVTSPDPQTVVFTFKDAACNAVNTAANLIPVPAHTFRDLYGDDYAAMNELDANLNPTVTSGRFTFLNYRPDEQVTLLANQLYPDPQGGAVYPEGYIDKKTTNQTTQVDEFLAGGFSFMTVPDSRRDEVQALVDAGQLQGVETKRFNTRFIALNMGDPSNPQPGLDADGNPVDQGMHPIFSDVRVRQALNYAIDYDPINQGVFFGHGVQGSTHTGATNWVDVSDIKPYPFDLEKAQSLLEDAGWTDTDGNGIRECHGCAYTQVDPTYEGHPLAFELLTNSGNVSQEALGNVLVDLWKAAGADVTFSPIDFNVLVDTFTAQTYDAVMIFWGFGFPEDPDGIRVTFGPENDVPGAGFNAVSYNNPQVNDLLDQALTLPGCDQAARADLYHQAYQILHDELPWIWIGGGTGLAVAQSNVQNFEYRETASLPGLWNVENWIIPPA